MRFAPQRRALFRHVNFQQWSDTEVLCKFWLGNVLRATTPCSFSTSQLPKVVRTWFALCILTWKCASRYNGVQLFISHLTTWLRTRRFSEPTFRPSGATKSLEKHSVSRLSYLFAHLDLLSSETLSFLVFFLLLFSSLALPISAFHLSILSEVWLLIPFDNHSFRIFPHFRKPPYRHPTINHPQRLTRNEWKNHYWIYPLNHWRPPTVWVDCFLNFPSRNWCMKLLLPRASKVGEKIGEAVELWKSEPAPASPIMISLKP